MCNSPRFPDQNYFTRITVTVTTELRKKLMGKVFPGCLWGPTMISEMTESKKCSAFVGFGLVYFVYVCTYRTINTLYWDKAINPSDRVLVLGACPWTNTVAWQLTLKRWTTRQLDSSQSTILTFTIWNRTILQYLKFQPYVTSHKTSVLYLSYITKILNDLRTTFRSGITKPLSWRRHQLLQLARFVQENADDLAECLRLDLGRPKQESFMAELGSLIQRCLICVEKLEEWVKPEELVVPDWQAGWKPRVEKHPKGVVLIIAYVFQCLPIYSVDLNPKWKAMELPCHSFLTAFVWCYICWLLCHHQTIWDINTCFLFPCTYSSQISWPICLSRHSWWGTRGNKDIGIEVWENPFIALL